MVKFLKINPAGRVFTCDTIQNDEHFQNMNACCYSLGKPQIWEHNEYRLVMYIERDNHCLHPNRLATDLLRHLSSNNIATVQGNGMVFLTNEDDEKEIDLTWDDFVYIYNKMEEKQGQLSSVPFRD